MNTNEEETTVGRSDRSRRGRSGGALVVAAVTLSLGLVIGLVAAGAVPARSDDPGSPARAVAPSRRITIPPPPRPTPTTEQRAPEPSPEPSHEPVEQTEAPSAGGFDLADGTYPVFIRRVDVDGATVTVDVIQIFEGPNASEAALEDGVARADARYLSIYVRNENDLLRTIPVAKDVRIHFIGVCETPPTRHAALTELRSETTPYDETFYYSMRLAGGEVERLAQHLAVVAC